MFHWPHYTVITEVILFLAIWPSNVPAKESRRCALFLIRELFCHDNAEAAKPQTIKQKWHSITFGVAKHTIWYEECLNKFMIVFFSFSSHKYNSFFFYSYLKIYHNLLLFLSSYSPNIMCFISLYVNTLKHRNPIYTRHLPMLPRKCSIFLISILVFPLFDLLYYEDYWLL